MADSATETDVDMGGASGFAAVKGSCAGLVLALDLGNGLVAATIVFGVVTDNFFGTFAMDTGATGLGVGAGVVVVRRTGLLYRNRASTYPAN